MTGYRDCAVVYVVWNLSGAEEALASATSVRAAMPDIAIHLKTGFSPAEVSGERWRVFDRVAYDSRLKRSFGDKFHFLHGVKQKKVLYLDADTHVVSGLRDAFDLLDRFDVACAHAPWRFSEGYERGDSRLPRVPAVFAEFNSGVIFCRNNRKMRVLLRACLELYEAYASPGEHTPDQPALRCALWTSGVSLYVLPPEYNARLCFPVFLSGEAKILHARLPDPREATRIANASLEPRTLEPEQFL